jgi:hypothetical protein
VRQLIPSPNEIIKQKLYKIDDKYCPPFIDLAVGEHFNGATQIGIYNGATGTVVGFGFHKAVPEEHFPIKDIFHTLKDREIPIVFVKMDKYTGAQISTDITKQNIVPFTESVNEVSLTVHGTHYMRWQLPLIVAYSITTR